MTKHTPLFRTEVAEHRADRLAGDVAIAVPVTWQTIGYLIFAAVVSALLFLLLASYARTEVVTGEIVPDAGVAAIMPSRNGVIVSVAVKEGDQVAAGAVLAMIRSEESSTTGGSSGEKIETAIAAQDVSLQAQIDAAKLATAAQQNQFSAQRSGFAAEILQIETQITLQRELVESAQRDLDGARQVAERGYISRRDLHQREDMLLSRRQTLSQLSQSLAAKRSAMAESERMASQSLAQANAQLANLAAGRAQVAQQAAAASGLRAYVLRAPIAGRVTALVAHAGQPAPLQTALMTIVPTGSVLRGRLAVPSAAIGFVKPGQEVRLAIDAFPYQRFGTARGRVLTVASSAVRQPDADAGSAPVYPVTIALERETIRAYGREEPLMPGMTFTSRIITQRQTLLQWLFEPLLAVQRR